MSNHSGSGAFAVQEMQGPLPSASQQSSFLQGQLRPPSPSSFLNDSFLLSAVASAASHAYPQPSIYLSSSAASNLLSSINAHFHLLTHPSTNDFDEKKDLRDQQILSSDVKNLIGSSLTAIGFGNVDDNDFDKASNTEATNDILMTDDQLDGFERSTTPGTNNTSPTHFIPSSSTLSNPTTRPMNIPHSFSNERFSYSPSAKSPFDAPNQLFDDALESVSDKESCSPRILEH